MNVFGSWRKLSLKNKLLLSYFLLIIFPLVFFSLFTYHSVSNTINRLFQFSARQSFDQTTSFLSEKLTKTIDISKVITFNTPVNDILSQTTSSLDPYKQFIDYDILSKFLNSLVNDESTNNIDIYLDQNLNYVSDSSTDSKSNFLSLQAFQKTSDYEKLMASKNSILWLAPKKFANSSESPAKISLIRKMLDLNNYSRQVAVLRIDILEKPITNILSKAIPTAHSFTYLENSNNEIVASFQYPTSNSYFSQIQLKDAESCVYFQMVSGNAGDKASYNACPIANTDWTMITVIPSDDLLAINRNIRNGLIILLLVIGTAAYSAAYGISLYFTRRINKLILKMRKLEQGNFNVLLSPVGNDEISELTQRFNDMVEKLHLMIKEQFRIGQEAKTSELKALQAQINPHFLYNTLDLINWTALNNGVPEIASIVRSLSKFYKISLNKGSDIISLSEEFEHVRLYADIQNRRFNYAFSFTFDIEDSVKDIMTVKLILQPLIENSIIHGILKKPEKAGSIVVSAKSMQNNICLCVHDDGMGMDATVLHDLLSENNISQGYGIKNINQRIKLYFGEPFGLTIASQLGKGTQITIIIPKQMKEITDEHEHTHE